MLFGKAVAGAPKLKGRILDLPGEPGYASAWQGRNDQWNAMTNTINNNAVEDRFEFEVEGHLASAYCHRQGNLVTFAHTEVRAEPGGKGIGSTLARGAPDQVRAKGLKVVAERPFVKAWIGKYPACSDLLEG